MSVGVVLFPGTNCEADVVEAVRSLGGDAEIVWHGDDRLASGVDAVVLPGGFAHGDYLRTGAIARFSPVMAAVSRFAAEGGPVVGICNGFQILCEAGLLPGALRKEERVVLRYVENPNGALDDIAGVCNAGRNVVGLMPHPERASHPLLGSTDGAVLLRSLLTAAGVSARTG